MQPLQVPAPGQVELAWLKSLDLRASWQLKIRERFMIEPSVAFFNAFNFANFDGANNTLAQTLQSLNPQIPNPGPAANNTTSRTASKYAHRIRHRRVRTRRATRAGVWIARDVLGV